MSGVFCMWVSCVFYNSSFVTGIFFSEVWDVLPVILYGYPGDLMFYLGVLNVPREKVYCICMNTD